jgi:putative hydrolase of the HAD superfamily
VQLKSRRAPGRAKPAAPSSPDRLYAPLRGVRARDRKLVWFFDLDNTLHDASHAIFGAIDSRMTSYVERHLAVDRAEADRIRRHYWLRYGATLLGLVRHHGIDP